MRIINKPLKTSITVLVAILFIVTSAISRTPLYAQDVTTDTTTTENLESTPDNLNSNLEDTPSISAGLTYTIPVCVEVVTGGKIDHHNANGTAEDYLSNRYCPTNEFEAQRGYSPAIVDFKGVSRAVNINGKDCGSIQKFEIPLNNPLSLNSYIGAAIDLYEKLIKAHKKLKRENYNKLSPELKELKTLAETIQMSDTIEIISDTGPFWDFTIPCKALKYCYDLLGIYNTNINSVFAMVTKDDCDTIFKKDMYLDCESKNALDIWAGIPEEYLNQVTLTIVDFIDDCKELADELADLVKFLAKPISDPVFQYLIDNTEIFNRTDYSFKSKLSGWLTEGFILKADLPLLGNENDGGLEDDGGLDATTNPEITLALPSNATGIENIYRNIYKVNLGNDIIYIQHIERGGPLELSSSGLLMRMSFFINEAGIRTYRMPISFSGPNPVVTFSTQEQKITLVMHKPSTPEVVQHFVRSNGQWIGSAPQPKEVAYFSEPKATDANGDTVPITQVIQNNELIITVDATGAALPVVTW